jgi:hypothetical protein
MASGSSTVVIYPDGAFALVNRKGRPLWLTTHRLRVPNQGLVVFEAAGDHDIVCLLCHRTNGVDADSRVETQAQPARACYEISFKSHQRTRTLLREQGVVRQEHIYQRSPLHRRAVGSAQRVPADAPNDRDAPHDRMPDTAAQTTSEREHAAAMLVDEDSKQRYWVAISADYVAAGLGWPGESPQVCYERSQRRRALSFMDLRGGRDIPTKPWMEERQVFWVGFSCWDTAVIFYRVDVLHLPDGMLFPLYWPSFCAPRIDTHFRRVEEHPAQEASLEGVCSSTVQLGSTQRQPDSCHGALKEVCETRGAATADLVLFWCEPDVEQPRATNIYPQSNLVRPETPRARVGQPAATRSKVDATEMSRDMTGDRVPLYASRRQLASASPVFRALLETSGMRETHQWTQHDSSALLQPKQDVMDHTEFDGIDLPGVSASCFRTALAFLEATQASAAATVQDRWSPALSLDLVYLADSFQWDVLSNAASQAIRRDLQAGPAADLLWLIQVANAAVDLVRNDLVLPAFAAIAQWLDHYWPIQELDGCLQTAPDIPSTTGAQAGVPSDHPQSSEGWRESFLKTPAGTNLLHVGLESMHLYVLLGVVSFWNRPQAARMLVQRWLTCHSCRTCQEERQTDMCPALDHAPLRMLLHQCIRERHPLERDARQRLDLDPRFLRWDQVTEGWGLADQDHLWYRPRLCLPPPNHTILDACSLSAMVWRLLQPSPWSREPSHALPLDQPWSRSFVRYIPGCEPIGILAFLGSQARGRVWRNPQRTGLVDVTASSLLNLNREHLCDHLGRAALSFVTPDGYVPNIHDPSMPVAAGEATDRPVHGNRQQNDATSWSLVKAHDPYAWIAIDFGAHRRVRLTHYALRHDERDDEYLREWMLEGRPDDGADHRDCGMVSSHAVPSSAASVDIDRLTTTFNAGPQAWLTLQHHRDDDRLASPHALAVWSLTSNPEQEQTWLPPLRYIRLRALRNSAGTDRLVLASWEFYGQVWWQSAGTDDLKTT